MSTYSYRGIITMFENVAYALQEARLCYGEEPGQDHRIIDNRKGDWGDIFPMTIISRQKYPLPIKLNLRWITLADLKCYESKDTLDTATMETLWDEQLKLDPEHPFKYVVVGIAPYGGISIWLRSNINAVLVQQLTAHEVEYDEKEKPVYSNMDGSDELMESIFPKNRLENVMKQFTYRYVVMEEYFDGKQWRKYVNEDAHYESIDIESLEDKRLDGTFDYTDGDSLYKYHTTGVPKRITVRWTEDGSYYYACFWLDSDYSTWFFDSFQHVFPDVHQDLLIRIDTRANRYEVAMGAEEVLPRAFVGTQYIVFKDFQEYSRSEYFNKEKEDYATDI